MNFKKLAVVALSGLMVLGGVCACSNQKSGAIVIDGDETSIVNPMKVVTEDEMVQETGITFKKKDGMENIEYAVLGGKVAQMDFTYKGVQYCMRAQETPTTNFNDAIAEMEDMSGMYYEWNEAFHDKVRERDAVVRKTDAGQAEVLWLDVVPGVEYSLTCQEKGDNILEVANEIFVGLQEEA